MRQQLKLVIWALLVMGVGALAGTPTLKPTVFASNGGQAGSVQPVQDTQNNVDSPEAPSGKHESLVLPYVAVGGAPEGWHFMTVVSLENRKGTKISGGMQFFNSEGSPMHVQMNDSAEVATESQWSLEPKESKLTVLSHPGSKFESGWLRVDASKESQVDVVVVVQFYNGDDLVGQAGTMAGPSQTLASYKLISADSRDAISLLKSPNQMRMINLRSFAKAAASSQTRKKTVPAEMGLASWYGYPYHGRQAADGSIYNKYQLTAAHRSLPFGTRARITNLRTHRSVTVKITDRGPFVNNRVIDLSKIAAIQIGMLKDGVAPVLLEVLPS
jgi:rare lipoprotein A (peptidoglycan hydrolase)